MPYGIAVTASAFFTWERYFDEDIPRAVWKKVAYACRYGKGVNLSEALSLPAEDLSELCHALSTIIEEEKGSST